MKTLGLLTALIYASNVQYAQDKIIAFETLDLSPKWHLKFEDNGSENWRSKWFLDGVRADISNTEEGMAFSAGPVAGDDACHAVLWTKEMFEGNIKIEYNYTRTDTQTKFVNILYIQASGKGKYPEDIRKWDSLRIIPYMHIYFKNMDALHVSYAAFENTNTSPAKDYIRVRRYPVLNNFEDTEVPPERFETGLFIPGITYKIKVIKTREKLYFKITGQNNSHLYVWDLTNFPALGKGRVGLRHMYSRSALYKNFKIFTQ